MSKKKLWLVFIISIVVYVPLALFTCYLVLMNGSYPGVGDADALCHIYKGEVLYNAIGRGEWYPLYDPLWYNGVEMLRYWAPLPVYVLAFCQLLAGGDAMLGYIIFVGLVFFFGGVAFSWIGVRLERPFMALFVGILWFYLPNNLYALFWEGNLPRSLSMVFLPLYIYQLYAYLNDGKRLRILWQALLFLIVACCHSGYAGMIALAMIVYLLIYGISNRCMARGSFAILAMLAGFMLMGIWLVPSLIGGITSTDSSEVMAGFFQSIFRTLDPTAWYREGVLDFYFSLAAAIVALFGLLCAPKKSRAAFATAILILLGTTNTAYNLLKMLPGSQYLWMLRFLSIALCLVLMGLLAWKSLKVPLQLAVCILLLIDCGCGLQLVVGDGSGLQPEERFLVRADETLIAEGKERTSQRMALMDMSTLGADGAYLVSGFNGATAGTFGAGWQSAATATNITQLNRAAESGQYVYLFDRALEMGNDTVLVRLSCVPDSYTNYAEIDEGAARSAYTLVASNRDWRLYHGELPEHFGVLSKYDAIGIGSGAGIISLSFPSVEETSDNDLSHYSFEELSQYRCVYLSGFTYSDKEQAEELLKQLADAGVRIVILADGMPEDPSSRRKAFLGVDSNIVRFRNGYPEMEVHGEVLNTDLFAEGYADWETVYVTGLDESYGWVSEDGLKLDFFGTVYNENIIFLGLNISYHYALTHDRSVGLILKECFAMDGDTLPERQVVEIGLDIEGSRIVVDSPENGLNTTLAWHDSFSADRNVEERNNLLYVDAGITEIKIHYPYLLPGLAVSIGGLLLLIGTIVSAAVYERKREEKANALS